MLLTRSRGRLEPPEVYSGNPLGECPECLEEVDEDEAHETLDGRFTHKACLPFCDHCRDVLLYDTCEEGMVLVAPGPVIDYRFYRTRLLRNGLYEHTRIPIFDTTFSGRYCRYCFFLVFFGIGE
jgi:hypothetical protein